MNRPLRLVVFLSKTPIDAELLFIAKRHEPDQLSQRAELEANAIKETRISKDAMTINVTGSVLTP